jgi:osmotically-inducible protein OsmY
MDGHIMIHAGFHDVTGRLRLLLAESPIAEIRKIRVEQEGDTVMLEGRVRSFYAKQMAQETIRVASNGLHIDNRVRVDEVVSQA